MQCPLAPKSPVLKIPTEHSWKNMPANGVATIYTTCEYCGSVHPDAFMQAVRERKVLVPTDKNYKAYITDELGHHKKFYFEHLSTEQKKELIKLNNDLDIEFAEPGYFYVMPLFCRMPD